MSRFGRGRRALTLAVAVVAAVALIAASGPAEEPPGRSAPDRVYHHERLGFTRMFDVVCEAAFVTLLELDPGTIQTSLDPVTGTPVAGVDDPPAERREWIEAHFDGDDTMAAAELVVEIRAVDEGGQPTSPSGEISAVAVWVDARATQSGSTKPVAQPLVGRYLAELDRSVAGRIRSSASSSGRGPTPTPWIGPSLEPTPLGPPELAPRTPVPGP